MKPKTVLIATTLAALGLMAACKPKVTDTGIRYVAVKDGLNMREEPSPTGKKMLTIPYRQEVQKLEEKPESFTIDKTPGKWTKVSYNGKTGWVFGGFLSSYHSAEESSRNVNVNTKVSVEEHFAAIAFQYTVGDAVAAVKSIGDKKLNGDGGATCANAYVVKEGQHFTNDGYVFKVFEENCMSGSEKCRTQCDVTKYDCLINGDDILSTPVGQTLTRAQCRRA